MFPIVIGTLKVLDLGYIVPDRPAFHSERYLLPVGYTSIRTYPSMHDPAKKCEYTCRILDGGEAPLVSEGKPLCQWDSPSCLLRLYQLHIPARQTDCGVLFGGG